MNAIEESTELLERWFELLASEPALRSRNAALRLGVSEGQLVAARCGDGATRLVEDYQRLLGSLEPLSEVLVITRNEHVVHEKRGFYRKLEFNNSYGAALDPNIDLRFNFRHWAHGFAVNEDGARGPRKSLQFFDRDGTSVHKIYQTNNTSDTAWRDLIGGFAHADQAPGLTPMPAVTDYTVEPREQADAAALRKDWLALEDVHAFQALLRRYRLRRIDALHLVGTDQARPVASDTWRAVLQCAADIAMPIMVFVASPGVVQIHTGPIQKLVPRDGWFNVLDPTFNLHLREEAIAQCWVVHKPTSDGGVNSVELYGRAGELIVQLFGARKPGIPELKGWRALLAEIPATDAVLDAV
ncbi:MAG: hemin-degrading factor [Nitrococcus sp.]|nr:hemin-degrading factor [Nitrococcus sp.]